MDIEITNDEPGGPALEYNAIGFVIDFYFLVGSETDPTAIAKQYANVVGTPAEVPYWMFGLHQCRFGYKGEFVGGPDDRSCCFILTGYEGMTSMSF